MKILFISLGCDKNLVDTEVMLGLLASRGYEMTDDDAASSTMPRRRASRISLRWQNIKNPVRQKHSS